MLHILQHRFSPQHFLIFAAMLLGLLGCQAPARWASADRGPAEEQRPNIVLIMADDMGFSDLGSYGSGIDTPHLDSLAMGGLRFTQFYNAAWCSPTRAALMTGRYPHQAGMGRLVTRPEADPHPEPGPYQGYLDEQSVTIAEALGPAGYRTYMSGKWHLGERPKYWPTRRGFDRYFGLISGAASYFHPIEHAKRTRRMALNGEPWTPPDSGGFYMTRAISDYAVRWLHEHQANYPDDPFFLYVPYTAPHWPLHALPADIAKYEGEYLIGWDSLRARRYERMLDRGVITQEHELTERPPSIPPWEEVDDKDEWARRMAVYAAQIDRMDQGIGRILQALRAMGAAENTLVLFLSDNGAAPSNILSRGLNDPDVPIGRPGSYTAYRRPWANASNTPYRKYKQWTYEGGIATPLVAYWPGRIKQPGRISDQTGHVMDLMATSLDLAGASYPDTLSGHPIGALEGKSLVPIFEGRKRKGHDVLFWERRGSRAVRKGRWKLVWGHDRKKWELYDMRTDPSETNDLSAEQPGRVAAMDSLWQGWADRVGVFPMP